MQLSGRLIFPLRFRTWVRRCGVASSHAQVRTVSKPGITTYKSTSLVFRTSCQDSLYFETYSSRTAISLYQYAHGISFQILHKVSRKCMREPWSLVSTRSGATGGNGLNLIERQTAQTEGASLEYLARCHFPFVAHVS